MVGLGFFLGVAVHNGDQLPPRPGPVRILPDLCHILDPAAVPLGLYLEETIHCVVNETSPENNPSSAETVPADGGVVEAELVSGTSADKRQQPAPDLGGDDRRFLIFAAIPSWMVSMIVHILLLFLHFYIFSFMHFCIFCTRFTFFTFFHLCIFCIFFTFLLHFL